jgi:stage V sporulation protein S
MDLFVLKCAKREKIGGICMELLKVSSKSSPRAVAGSISAYIRNGERVEINAIGAGAVNQAVKGIAIARGFVAANGIEIVTIPMFTSLLVDGTSERTLIKFVVEKR